MKNKVNNNKGFTLIELLVVMAIIAILAGVVMVSMTSYRDKATASAALQTLSSVMPFATKCVLERNPLNIISSKPVEGGPICSGSSGTWPALNNGSTSGCKYPAWSWDDGNTAVYQACCGLNSQITCSVTYDNSPSVSPMVRPGTCIQWNTACP